jgi:hypothetical protein
VVLHLFSAVTAFPGAYSIVGMGAVVTETTHGLLSAISISVEDNIYSALEKIASNDFSILPVVAPDDHSQLLGVSTLCNEVIDIPPSIMGGDPHRLFREAMTCSQSMFVIVILIEILVMKKHLGRIKIS